MSHLFWVRRPNRRAPDFYPPDATKAEIEAWIKSLPAAEQENAKGFFTVVRRQADRKFTLVPYNIEYEGELTRAAGLLREAAAAAAEPTLKKFLTTRADAFLSNDYYPSDVAWMELKGSDRADDRTLRGLRGRVVQLQSRLRVLHHCRGRSRKREAGEIFRPASGHRGSSADRPEVSQPEDRRPFSDGRSR